MESKEVMTKTYLYIKQHKLTGKLYFGKTSFRHPEKYMGSGIHWQRHVRKHGVAHVETLWWCLFTDAEELTKFALMFSEQHDIVNSPLWANLIKENGLDGGSDPGRKFSNEHRAAMSAAHKARGSKCPDMTGMVFVNNGVKARRVPIAERPLYLSQGWNPGMVKTKAELTSTDGKDLHDASVV